MTTICESYDLFINDFEELEIENIYDFGSLSFTETIKDHSCITQYDYFYQLMTCCIGARHYMNKRREFLIVLYIVNNMDVLVKEQCSLISYKNPWMKRIHLYLFQQNKNYYRELIQHVLHYMTQSVHMDIRKDQMHFITMTDIFVNNFNARFLEEDIQCFIQILNAFTTKSKRIQNNIQVFVVKLQAYKNKLKNKTWKKTSENEELESESGVIIE